MGYIGAGISRFNTADELTVTGDAEFNGNANFGDSDKAQFGAGSDLQIYHDSSNSYVKDAGTGDLLVQGTQIKLQDASGNDYLRGFTGGSVYLHHAGNSKFETTSTGVAVTGNATFADNGKAIFGAGSDLEIYHDGSNSFVVDNGTGGLQLRGSTFVALQGTNGENGVLVTENGSAQLRFNNSPKLETTGTGIDVTGDIVATGATSGVAKLRLAAEEVHGEIEGINIGNNFGGLAFKTNSNGTTAERMRIDSSGNVGIGTSPATILHVQGADPNITIQDTNDTGDAYIRFKNNSGTQRSFIQTAMTSNVMLFGTGTTEAMRIPSGGNVGIGTSSPNEKLSVSGNIELYNDEQDGYIWFHDFGTASYAIGRDQSSDTFSINRNTDLTTNPLVTVTSGGNVGISNSAPDFNLSVGNSSSVNPSIQIMSATNSNAQLLFGDGAGAAGYRGTVVYGNATDSMSFSTAGAERMRIDSSGNVLINKTSTATSAAGIMLRSPDTAYSQFVTTVNTEIYHIGFVNGNGLVGKIATNGSGTTYSTTSDIRLKTDIEPLQATDKLMAMNPVSYAWKVDPDGPRSMGFIAQEMRSVMPEAVSGTPDGEDMMSMDYGRITPILVSALQDAHRKIEQLENRIAAMETK